jgi:hypothetical protein
MRRRKNRNPAGFDLMPDPDVCSTQLRSLAPILTRNGRARLSTPRTYRLSVQLQWLFWFDRIPFFVADHANGEVEDRAVF